MSARTASTTAAAATNAGGGGGIESVQKHSVHTLVFRSLKRTHDMFLSDESCLPDIDENTYVFFCYLALLTYLHVCSISSSLPIAMHKIGRILLEDR